MVILKMLQPDQHFLDTSFERISPQLPPVFEFDGLKYIDTARVSFALDRWSDGCVLCYVSHCPTQVEPRIGYSPEKTPPKTPETPHYRQKPFATPYAAQQHPPGAVIEMREMSPIQVGEVWWHPPMTLLYGCSWSCIPECSLAQFASAELRAGDS